jgi:hypothetical protein
MNNNEFEYYRVRWKNNNNIPRLVADKDCPKYLYDSGQIENPELMLFKLGQPIPRNPIMADYLTCPSSVISKKIYDVLEPMQIKGIQLLPAIINGKDDEVFENYWAIHMFNMIKCVDVKASICELSPRLSSVEKLVLDFDILKKIPLKDRLVFLLRENTAYELFHVSVVNAITAKNPTGIRFINTEILNERNMFSD